MLTFDKLLRNVFSKYGMFAYRARYVLFVMPIIFTILLGLGILKLDEVRTLKPEDVFAPTDGPHIYERKVLQEHFPLIDDQYIPGKQLLLKHWLEILVFPYNHSHNILANETMQIAIKLNDWILDTYSIEVWDDFSNQSINVTYRNLCLRWRWKCYENEHLTLLKDHSAHWLKYNKSWAQDFVKSVIHTQVQLTFPNASSGGNPVYLGSVVGKPHLIDTMGHFSSAKGIRIVYSLKEGKDIDVFSDQWVKNLTYLIAKGGWLARVGVPDGIVDLGIFHSASIEDGLIEVSEGVTHHFASCFIILSIFAIIFTSKLVPFSDLQNISIDVCRSKPLLGLANLMTSAMSVLSAVGFLMSLGVSFNDTVTTMPFLIVCDFMNLFIGSIDDVLI